MPRRTSTSPPLTPAAAGPAPALADDTRRILDALRRIVRDLRRTGRAAVAPTLPGGTKVALGPARLFVLQQLAEHGALGVSELASRTHTDPSSVSIVVKQLVAAGLVSRSTGPIDHRRAVLALTASGRAAIRKAPKAVQHQLLAAIDGLGSARRRTLARLLEAVVDTSQSDPNAPLFFEDDAKRKRGAR